MSPFASKHPCSYPGCTILVGAHDSQCERHRIQERGELENRRRAANLKGYGSRWRSARKCYLVLHPLCAECQRMGRLTVATVVDHIVAHKGLIGHFIQGAQGRS